MRILKKWKGRVRPKRVILTKEEKLKRRADREKKMKVKYSQKAIAWRKAHSAELKAYGSAYSKTYYLSNRSDLLKYAESYRNENKEKIEIRLRAYRAAHPEKQRVRSQKYKARKKKATIGDTKPIEKWEKKWRRKTSVKCYWCSKEFSPKNCHSDHVIPLKNGGSHAIGNLCISCRTCNTSKQAKPLSEWNTKLEQPALF